MDGKTARLLELGRDAPGGTRLAACVLRLVVPLIILVCSGSGFAQQQWQRTYGGSQQDRGLSVRQTPDGGYIATGFTFSFGVEGEDVYLVRTDSSGDTLWTRSCGGTGSDEGQAVRPTQDGGFIVAGATSSFGNHDWQFYLIRTDAAGDTLWTRTYSGVNGASAYSVAATPDFGYILAGVHYTGSGIGAYLIKTDSSGDTLWTRTYVIADGASAKCVEPTFDGGYIVAGDVATTNSDVLLIRTNASGDTLWTRSYGGADYDYGNSVRQTPDSGFVIAGTTQSFGAGNWDIYLIKTDARGETLWTRTYGGPADDAGRSVDLTLDGGYIIAGWSTGDRTCLIRTDASGETLWTRSYGGADVALGYDARQTSDGGYILTGDLRSDLCLIKTDAGGNAAVLENRSVEPRTASSRGTATVVRGALQLPSSVVRRPSSDGSRITDAERRFSLLDISGRKVLDLKPGSNDVSRLAPGVYFISERSAVSGQHSAIRKVIVTE